MRVAILTEGGKSIGFGHITRCTALYQAFIEKGTREIEMLINADNTCADLLKNIRHKIFNWLLEKDKLFKILKGTDILILDSYLAPPNFYKKVSGSVKVGVYLDDTARIDYPKGIVLNSILDAQKISYPKRKGLDYLLGIKYVSLRKEFWEVAKKHIKKDIESILISIGGDDAKNIIPKILKFLRERYPTLKKNVIIGKVSKNTDEIKKEADQNANLVFNPDAKMMKEIMSNSDIAISAAGQTLFELARLGVPTIGICLAKNQERNLEGLKRKGFLLSVGWYDDKELFFKLGQNIVRLTPQEERARRSKIGQDLIDGKGAERVVCRLGHISQGMKKRF